MRDHRVMTGKSLGNEVIVRDLQEGVHRGGFVTLARRPCADPAERGDRPAVRPEKEAIPSLRSPGRKFVGPSIDLVLYLFDAEDATAGVPDDQPLPEGGAKI